MMIALYTVRVRIDGGYYNTKLPFVTARENRAKYDAYNNDVARLNDEFKRDLLEALGIAEHPKADLLFQKAWDYGHASGLFEVLFHAEDLAELIK